MLTPCSSSSLCASAEGDKGDTCCGRPHLQHSMASPDAGKCHALARSRRSWSLMLAVHGQGARRVRQEHLSMRDPTIPLSLDHWPHERLRVVPRYKHLGGQLHHRGLLMVELKSRIAQSWKAYQSLFHRYSHSGRCLSVTKWSFSDPSFAVYFSLQQALGRPCLPKRLCLCRRAVWVSAGPSSDTTSRVMCCSLLRRGFFAWCKRHHWKRFFTLRDSLTFGPSVSSMSPRHGLWHTRKGIGWLLFGPLSSGSGSIPERCLHMLVGKEHGTN